jgi:hypothetical protein
VVKRELPKVTAPCLVAHATEDDVASVENAYLVARSVSGPVEMLLLEDSYHMITIDRERRTLIHRTAEFFSKVASTAFPARAPSPERTAVSPLVATLWLVSVSLETGGQLSAQACRQRSAAGDGAARWRYMASRPWMWLGILTYVVKILFWIAFLSLVDLSEGVLLSSINIVVIMIAGRLLFREKLYAVARRGHYCWSAPALPSWAWAHERPADAPGGFTFRLRLAAAFDTIVQLSFKTPGVHAFPPEANWGWVERIFGHPWIYIALDRYIGNFLHLDEFAQARADWPGLRRNPSGRGDCDVRVSVDIP